MNRVLKILLALALVAALAAAALYWWERNHQPALPPAAKVEVAPAPPAPPPGPRNPLPTTPAEKPLPALNASDADTREALAATLPPSAIERLVFDNFIRRVVATIDNLPREQYAARLNPMVPVPGVPRTSGKADALTWAPENAARYAPYIAAWQALDSERLVGFYLRYYPLFQQAYMELGYPQGYFNDRLVEVIDHLLGAPEVVGPVKLVQPKVLYEFADPELQQASAGRKVLVRMGAENAAKVKAKLREIRAKVAREKP
jgi:hypothetical protein